jgi:SAM-dependent methyltransferase
VQQPHHIARLPPLDDASDQAIHIAHMFRAGRCPSDSSFDQLLSERARGLSSNYWTPLLVALRAAQWFEACGVRTVVDIGSGAGKFCVAAALAGRCHFTGLEHREHLVTCARTLARAFNVENRVYFLQGALGAVRLPAADAYYLFNPFEENVLRPEECIDRSVELSDERQTRDVQAVKQLLFEARAGTFVLTYNGFGGHLPPGYREVRTDRELPNVLRLWKKMSSVAARTRRTDLADMAGAA